MIDEKRLIEELKEHGEIVYGCDVTNIEDVIDFEESNEDYNIIYEIEGLHDAFDIINQQPKVKEWIPFKLDEDGILETPLPKEYQEILISDGDFVWADTFLKDGEDCYIESNIDLIGLCWMPLPEPHKKEV